jgi:hypothetical protein
VGDAAARRGGQRAQLLPGNLPRDLEREKIETSSRRSRRLSASGRAPTSPGRYGFGPNTAATLLELGFEVDLSPLPAFDLSADGGPDWSRAPLEPREVRPGLLAIPATSAFTGFARGAGAGAPPPRERAALLLARRRRRSSRAPERSSA